MFYKYKFNVALVFALLISLTYSISAQEHHAHKHHVAVFAGATSNLDAEHTDFTLGIDYEYRLPYLRYKFGIGLFGEIVFAEHKETIVGVPLFYHPTDGLKFVVGAGMAYAEDGHGHSHAHFLFRVGTGYDFHVWSFSISPTFNADFIDGHVSLIYGAGFGIGF